MNNVFCTVVSKLRLYQLVAFVMSVHEVLDNFLIYVLCVDDDSFNLLNKIQFNNVRLVHLCSFNDKRLLSLKNERALNEYCWTLKPFFIYHLIKKNNFIERITYVDSDLFFWRNPEKIFLNQPDSSILLSKGNLVIPFLEKEIIQKLQELMGLYNSGFISFKNDKIGRSCIKWWKEKCLNSCINTPQEGQFGDQKYLDDIPALFKNTEVIKTPGVNIGHWNNLGHEFCLTEGKITVDGDELICYHFSGFRIVNKDTIITIHEIGRVDTPFFYQIYKEILKKIINMVCKADKDFDGFANKEDLMHGEGGV
ncbi:MAG: hypothetical protein M0R40_01800 [Firmicutes bacterium]|nr:hypothetical protein [Bacillota bacterium]